MRDYILCADGERGLIQGPDGEIVWMCAPLWDSDAVFSALLGGRGHYTLNPATAPRVAGGCYEPGTLIWRHVWTTARGSIECHDTLACPGDSDRAVILRKLTRSEQDHTINVTIAPRAEYGHAKVAPATHEDGVWSWDTGGVHVRVTGLDDATFTEDGALVGTIDLVAGDEHDIVAELSTRPGEDRTLDAPTLWDRTRKAWGERVPNIPAMPADGEIAQFYSVANGLMSASGGMVAAVTTGLPEHLHGTRNYDYRYSWIRDYCYSGQTDAIFGDHRILDLATGFIAQRLHDEGSHLLPAYTVRGDRVPDEHRLPVPGYPDATPMAGNHMHHQFQLDVFGEVLSLFAQSARLGRLDEAGWAAARIAADAVGSRWEEPDAGLWELENRWWTHSRLACVAGLRQLSAYASHDDAKRWRSLADTIYDRLRDTCVKDGRWKRAQDDDGVDASLFLPAIRGGLDPGDPLMVGTVEEVMRTLKRNGHLYRFKHGESELGTTEGAFLLCEAAMSLIQLRLGNRTEAVRWFERVRGCVGPAGLFSEEWDASQRQMRGNLPQAFVHALVAQAAVELADAGAS